MRDTIGQTITFASELDPDVTYTNYTWIRVSRTVDTVAKIAAAKGHRELASTIAQLNGIRSVRQKLRPGRRLKVPGILAQSLVVDAYAQNGKRPVVKDGYATYQVVTVPGAKGINQFLGYNPISMDVYLTFEAWLSGDGVGVESSIETLERMAGRGNYPGAASGPPAVLRVSVTDALGNIVPLIPTNYQWTKSNPTAPLYRITGIDWGDGTALSGSEGRRRRQDATVTITEYTPIILASPSAATRARAKANRQSRPD